MLSDRDKTEPCILLQNRKKIRLIWWLRRAFAKRIFVLGFNSN